MIEERPLLSDSDLRLLRGVVVANRIMGYLSLAFAGLFFLTWGMEAWSRLQQSRSLDRVQHAEAQVMFLLAIAYSVFVCTVGVAHTFIAWSIAHRRFRTATLVLTVFAALNIACAPINTVVALLTAAALLRDSTKAAFQQGAAPYA